MGRQLNSFLNLACLRRARGVSLEQIQRSTRIRLHSLQAIEAEEFAKLPGSVYSTNYLRQYANATGYDESALLSRYYEQMEPESTPEPVQPQSRILRKLRDYEPLRNFFDHLAERQRKRDDP